MQFTDACWILLWPFLKFGMDMLCKIGQVNYGLVSQVFFPSSAKGILDSIEN